MAMAKMLKRKRGGKVADEAKSDNDEDDRARGGRTVARALGGKIPARKAGGAIGGASESGSLAKRARGGGIGRGGRSFARGGSPLSSASSLSHPGGGGQGHEGSDSPKEAP
jgi:hypothetical protein